MKTIILVVSVIVGSLIGAGFASGKEIQIFFCQFGTKGLIGIGISSCFIGAIIYLVFQMMEKYKVKSYDEFLNIIIRENQNSHIKEKQKEWIIIAIQQIANSFLLLSFFIMIAGFGSYVYQEFGLPSIWGAMMLAFLCYMTFQKGINGIVKVSSILIPILISFIVILGIQKGEDFLSILDQRKKVSFLAYGGSAILYGSYNTILLIPILFPLKSYIKNKKNLIKICILTVSIIALLATIIYSVIVIRYEEIEKIEMPMLWVVGKESQLYRILYGILILVSIYTTAISTGFGFLENVAKGKYQKKQVSVILCVLSVFISNIGFSSLVKVLYPVFGIMGLWQIYQILKCLKST